MAAKQIGSVTGTDLVNEPAAAPSDLRFPKRLIHPPKSQIVQSEDAVADRIGKFDAYAQRLGEAFGIPFTSFELNPLPQPKGDVHGLAVAAAMLLWKTERVTLDRRSGRWGLYFTREPSLVQSDKKYETVLLKDAPLDVRERFLQKSEEFFRGYLATCEKRLDKMHSSVASADRTLQLLDNLKLV
jgi:hypothetical protein